MPSIYFPAEDSLLLAKCVEKICRKMLRENENLKILDIGTGSGIQAMSALKAGVLKKNILAADINRKAVDFMRKKGFNARVSCLFSKIPGKFDLIIFNPPYLPQDALDKGKDTTGGRFGDETILRFLEKVRDYLNNGGKILLVLSSLTPKKRILAEIRNKRLRCRQIATEKVFFEEIFVCLLQ